jgi:hypothetical protein
MRLRTNLPSKGQRRLIKSLLLRISDVCGDHLVKWKAMIRILEHFSVFLRLDGQFASDSVLDILDAGIEGGGGEGGHCSAEEE